MRNSAALALLLSLEWQFLNFVADSLLGALRKRRGGLQGSPIYEVIKISPRVRCVQVTFAEISRKSRSILKIGLGTTRVTFLYRLCSKLFEHRMSDACASSCA